MSGILTQDSISLTESLDGVRFGYLATSSRKVGTIRWNTKHPTHSDTTKGWAPFPPSAEGNRYLVSVMGPHHPNVAKWTVKFIIMSLSLDTLYVTEA